MGQVTLFIHTFVFMILMLGQVVPWVELPVQRRLYSIFVISVESPEIHEYSAS